MWLPTWALISDVDALVSDSRSFGSSCGHRIRSSTYTTTSTLSVRLVDLQCIMKIDIIYPALMSSKYCGNGRLAEPRSHHRHKSSGGGKKPSGVVAAVHMLHISQFMSSYSQPLVQATVNEQITHSLLQSTMHNVHFLNFQRPLSMWTKRYRNTISTYKGDIEFDLICTLQTCD